MIYDLHARPITALAVNGFMLGDEMVLTLVDRRGDLYATRASECCLVGDSDEQPSLLFGSPDDAARGESDRFGPN